MTVEDFVRKWIGLAGGAEKANFGPFIYDLVRSLDLPEPEPAEAGKLGAYQFEGPIPNASFRNPQNKGSADLYKRGCFIMEAKQSYMPPKGQRTPELFGDDASIVPLTPAGARYDKYMTTARAQVENYAKNLPAIEPAAPFLIVCDIGRAFEVYYDSAGNGRGYTFFPDKQSYRIPLPRLRDPDVADRLRAIWTNPRSIDPRFKAADVTREVAMRLASVSEYIEDGLKPKLSGKSPQEKAEEIEEAALFLMRILFCMFAEDIGLLPKDKFKEFLKRAEDNEKLFQNQLADLWLKMGAPDISPRFAHAVENEVKYFNGGLFSESAPTYPLGAFVIHQLFEAASQNWRKVEPAIFGTLLEQALSPEERSKLGAHYTPRPYVETLVRATIIDVLELEWREIEDSAEDGLRERAEAFHKRLGTIRVLDPACGTGNFLYVSMELMQALESRVAEMIEALGGIAEPQVGPHQFHGLEKNPRAAKIAELVLWIGWLRNRLRDDPDSVPQPVLAESASINFGRQGGYDAVLKMNSLGEPDLENPVLPDWPDAEFIVGNPPFIGGKDLREELGSPYVKALRKANKRVNASADFVMHWWDRAAHILAAKQTPLIRFGFVTTNSITQKQSRKVIAHHLSASDISLAMAIPDHPWIKKPKEVRSKAKGSARGKKKKGPAAVRIAMTVAQHGQHDGRLIRVQSEAALDTDEPQVEYELPVSARINPDLTTGVDVTTTKALKSNEHICSPGVKLHGRGFVVTPGKAQELELLTREGLTDHIRPYLNGRDLLQRPRGVMVIDLFGMEEAAVMDRYPEVYQHLFKTVKAERNRPKKSGEDRVVSYADRWWEFGVPRQGLRSMVEGLDRFIATVETAKHRTFQFFDAAAIPDNKLTIVASDDGFVMGVLSSSIHLIWAARNKGQLEDRPVYVKSTCFDPYPFPDAPPVKRQIIEQLANRLDATRKAAIAETDNLTMTELYNLREKQRSGMPMSDKEQRRAAKARATIIDRLHEQLDEAVADAYGWGPEWKSGTLGPTEIIARLVSLNAQRHAEEERGKIRWLRPDFQKSRLASREQET